MPENIYNLSIFQGIDREIIADIVNHCEHRPYDNNAQIVTEGNESNGEGYIIKNGKVAISINNQKIAELNDGDIFGEIALLNEENRTATVKAIGDLEVIVLSYDNLIEMINNDQNIINKTIMKRIEENIERE